MVQLFRMSVLASICKNIREILACMSFIDPSEKGTALVKNPKLDIWKSTPKFNFEETVWALDQL